MRCKDTNFLGFDENIFCGIKKYAYFCNRFHKEIVEALYLRLANENLRNFQEMQASVMASRVWRGLLTASLSQGISQDHHSKKWYTVPRFLFNCLSGYG